jgi:hypothetical protein
MDSLDPLHYDTKLRKMPSSSELPEISEFLPSKSSLSVQLIGMKIVQIPQIPQRLQRSTPLYSSIVVSFASLTEIQLHSKVRRNRLLNSEDVYKYEQVKSTT